MRSEIKELHQRLKVTTVYVTHDQIEAMTMADKIVVMHDGNVEQMGPPLELYDRPRNLFVASFIGSPAMNMLDGKIAGGAVVAANGLNLPLASVPAGAEGRRVQYGIRPEHLSIAADGLLAEVVVVEPTGSETQLYVRCGQQQIVGLLRERIAVRPGDSIRIRPDTRHVHLFDAESGARL